MSWKVKDKIYEVTLTYNIQEDDSFKALDKITSVNPIKPISFSVEPMVLEEENE